MIRDQQTVQLPGVAPEPDGQVQAGRLDRLSRCTRRRLCHAGGAGAGRCRAPSAAGKKPPQRRRDPLRRHGAVGLHGTIARRGRHVTIFCPILTAPICAWGCNRRSAPPRISGSPSRAAMSYTATGPVMLGFLPPIVAGTREEVDRSCCEDDVLLLDDTLMPRGALPLYRRAQGGGDGRGVRPAPAQG